MTLNTADAVYVGDVAADRVYLGDLLVWEPASTDVGYAGRVKSLAPLSYWRLGESAGASVGVDQMNRYGVTYTGSPTLGVAGLVDDADTGMQVAGVINQGASSGNPQDYWLQTLTLEAWIKTSGAGASYRGIIVKQDGYGLFAVDNVLSVYEWSLGQATGSGVNIADGQRHHVAVVFQPTGSQMYVDGVPAGPTFNDTTGSHGYPLTIGYAQFSGQEFSGSIDEVAIYGRALTAAEVAGNYQAGVGTAWGPESIPGLAVWIDPAQDVYVNGEKVASYVETPSDGLTFAADSRPEYQPIFRTNPPRIEFPNPCFGLVGPDINLGLAGLTFVVVNQHADFANFPMTMVHGPEADGVEMRNNGAAMQIVARYSNNQIVFSLGAPSLTRNNVQILRIAYGVRSDAWVNDTPHPGAAGCTAINVPWPQYIGRRQGGYYYRGTMAEVLVYAGPVADADLTLLRDYLTTKHSL